MSGEILISFNPSGSFNDSRDNDLNWNGDIQAATSSDNAAWHLEARIRISDLGLSNPNALTANVERYTSGKTIGHWDQARKVQYGLLTLAAGNIAVEDIALGVFSNPRPEDRGLPLRICLRNLQAQKVPCTVEAIATDANDKVLHQGSWNMDLEPTRQGVLAVWLPVAEAAKVRIRIAGGQEPWFQADLPIVARKGRTSCAANESLVTALRPPGTYWLSKKPMPVYLLAQTIGELPAKQPGELVLRHVDTKEIVWRCHASLDLPLGTSDAKSLSIPMETLAPGQYVLDWQIKGLSEVHPLQAKVDYAPIEHIEKLAAQTTAYELLVSMDCNAPQDPADVAIVQFKLDRLADLMTSPDKNVDTDRQDEIHSTYQELMAVVEELKANGCYLLRKRGWVEAAFWSPADGSAQPYSLFIPPDYDPQSDKSYPLDIWLHGMSGTHKSAINEENPNTIGDWFLFRPLARGRSCGYLGVAGNDVIQAIAAIKDRYRIDEDGVHLTGSSMGGFGSFELASRYPDVFATCRPDCGGGDWNPLEQMRNLPTIIHHGLLDAVVPSFCSSLAAIKMNYYNCPVQLFLHPGVDHNSSRGVANKSTPRDSLRQIRRDGQPPSVVLSGDMLCFTKAYWASIERFTDPQRPGRVEAVFAGGNHLVVNSRNVKWMKLALPCKWVDPNMPVHISRQDGLNWTQITTGEAKAIYLRLDGDKIEATADRPAEMDDQTAYTGGGALRMLCEGRPVRIVYGSGGDPNAAAAAEKFAKSLRRVGFIRDNEFEVGGWPVLKDTDVSQETIEQCDLILLGTPADNALLARMADQLPVKVADGNVQVQANMPMQWAKDDVVFTLYYRNPLAKDRRIWWLCGFDDKKKLIGFANPFDSDLAVGRKQDGVRIATAEVVGDWRLRREEPLTSAKEMWATDKELCQAFANELKGSFPVDIVLSDIGMTDPNRTDFSLLTVGEALGSFEPQAMHILELSGKELSGWYRKQTTSAPTRPSKDDSTQERFRGTWAGIPVDQLKDEQIYRVLTCGDAIWRLADANLPFRIVRYIPADDFEPVRGRFLEAKGIKPLDPKPTSQSSK